MGQLRGAGQPPGSGTDRGNAERMRRVSSALQRCSLFAGVKGAGFATLSNEGTIVRVARRRVVYTQADKAPSLYVVSAGRARVVRQGGEDRALTVAYRGASEIIGETAIVDGLYQDTATATEQLEAVRLPLPSVRALLRENPDFANAMLELMVERRLQAERRIESLLSRTVESRVAEFLLDAADRHGIPESRGVLIGVKYTHQEIADYVGSTRETVTLTLGELRRREILLFDHRRIVIADPSALRMLV